jgi:selenocysteine lyase/cysteine desulfurase
MTALADAQRLFDARPGYFNTASNGVPPLSAVAAMRAAIDDWQRGRSDQANASYFEAVTRGRAAFARLVRVPADQVAIGGSVSALVGLVAAALPACAEVLVADGDFTAVLFPFEAQQARGVTVRSVPLAELPSAVNERTTLVAVSSVQSVNGALLDLAGLVTAARAHGAATMLDATQACGWLPTDATEVDFVVCGAYKWLLSPNGVAFLSVSPDWLDRITPAAAGWYAGEDIWESIYGLPLRLAKTTRRLDASPAWMCWAAAAPALELLDAVGVESIREHDVTLANRLRAGLGLGPAESAIVSVPLDDAAQQRLAAAGVVTSVRAGGVRFSCHLYTRDADVDAALNAINPR